MIYVSLDYSFIEKIKQMKYEPDLWRKYSHMGLQHAFQSKWFSRYQGAMYLDGFIESVFRKARRKSPPRPRPRRVANGPNFQYKAERQAPVLVEGEEGGEGGGGRGVKKGIMNKLKKGKPKIRRKKLSPTREKH